MTSVYGGELKNPAFNGEERELKKKIAELPRLILTRRQQCDLELLINGGFSPLWGFMGEDDYVSVCENMRLSCGVLWPIPVVLDVAEHEKYVPGGEIILCNQLGVPLALFSVTSRYLPDKKREAELVYGTRDKNHFGVRYLFENTKDIYLGGRVRGFGKNRFFHFCESPRELREWFEKNGWKTVIGFQTRNPIHRGHFEVMQRAHEMLGGGVLIHPVVGETKTGDIDPTVRMRCYKILWENYAKHFAKLSMLPLAMRMAGPREAILHAIVRKNYGCTHFIVGRDHAGPGKDAAGKPFYESYEAQELALRYADELGITIVPFKEMVYVPDEKRFFSSDEIRPHHAVMHLSGTEVRRRLTAGEEIPEWFSFPEVVRELRKEFQKHS